MLDAKKVVPLVVDTAFDLLCLTNTFTATRYVSGRCVFYLAVFKQTFFYT